MDFFKILSDVGFPIASAIMAGYFIFLTLKFILAGVSGHVKTIETMVVRLDKRVGQMNNDISRLDLKISHALGLQPHYERVSRAVAGDQRKD